MGRPLKITHGAGIDVGFNNPSGYGVVGGDTGITGDQILCRVKIGSNAEANGHIIRQKGARKFLVSDGTNVGICVLADSVDTALANDTMTVSVTKADTSVVRLSHFTNHYGVDFSGNGYTLSFGAAGAAPTGSPFPVVTVNKM